MQITTTPPPAGGPGPMPDDDGLEDVLHNGRFYRVPPPIKAVVVAHANHGRQVQALAEAQAGWQRQRAAEADLDDTLAHLRASALSLQAQLAPFKTLDWHGLAAQNPAEAARLWSLYQELENALAETLTLLDHAAGQHSAHQQREHAATVQHGHAVLTRDLPGWSPQLAAQLAAMGQTEFGFTPEELTHVTDPRLIKLLHRACVATIAARGQPQVSRIAAGQKTEPAQMVRGAAGRATSADTGDFAAFERMADARMKRRP